MHGVVYLRMLGKDVERQADKTPSEQDSVCSVYWVDRGSNSMAQLQILPIFLGFLTQSRSLSTWLKLC